MNTPDTLGRFQNLNIRFINRIGAHIIALGFATACAGARAASAPVTSSRIDVAIASADSIVEDAIKRTLIPGAEMVVAVDGRVLQDRAFGFAQLNDFDLHRLPSPKPMHSTTLFDLASVTKVMG